MKNSPNVSPTYSGYSESRSASGVNSPQNSPSKSTGTWERHYGCLRGHFQSKQICATNSSNSTPGSPVHHRVDKKNSRSDSVTSISSMSSVVSLPTRPLATPCRDPVLANKSNTHCRRISSCHLNRSCPSTPQRTPVRRQLPATTLASSSTGLGSFRCGSSLNTKTSKSQTKVVQDTEEDETLTLVLHTTTVASKALTTTASIWTTSSISPVQLQPSSSRINTGITRWVMKRSVSRYKDN